MISPGDVRKTISEMQGFPLGRPVLLVIPGVGPLYAMIKKLPSAAQQMAGIESVIHGSVPRLVGLPGSSMADRLPRMERFMISGRDDVESKGHFSLSPDEMRQFWDDMGEAYARARPLPVEDFDNLDHWALMHDAALARLKAGNIPGASATRIEAPQLYAYVLAQADGYHQRAVEMMERALHGESPSLYPAEPGWLTIPEGIDAPAREMVPLRRLLNSAPDQAQALLGDEQVYSAWSMDY